MQPASQSGNLLHRLRLDERELDVQCCPPARRCVGPPIIIGCLRRLLGDDLTEHVDPLSRRHLDSIDTGLLITVGGDIVAQPRRGRPGPVGPRAKPQPSHVFIPAGNAQDDPRRFPDCLMTRQGLSRRAGFQLGRRNARFHGGPPRSALADGGPFSAAGAAYSRGAGSLSNRRKSSPWTRDDLFRQLKGTPLDVGRLADRLVELGSLLLLLLLLPLVGGAGDDHAPPFVTAVVGWLADRVTD
mmetsp:Transcript_27928/g.82086  ORF Transcript_27928/g.82086 Transcript_27928/m.82086 type:complete len:242 (-) Transcript_27928:781-1506(-)